MAGTWIGDSLEICGSDTMLIFLEPLSSPTKRPCSRRKTPPYIFTSIGLYLADVGLPTLPLTRRLCFFFFSSFQSFQKMIIVEPL